jgi:polar amino acid transport system permease protein
LGIKVLTDGANFQRLLEGLGVTAYIAFVSAGLSFVLGIVFGVIMTSKRPVLYFLSRFYFETIRIVPTLVLLFIFYFGLASNFGVNISAVACSIIVFTVWGTAEMGDIVRGAITSISPHQYESAAALGLSRPDLYRCIIIPQAIRRLLPGAINLITRMVKTTSLVYLIGVVEMLKVGQQIIEVNLFASPSAPFWVYLLIFAFYFIICFPISRLAQFLEKRWA